MTWTQGSLSLDLLIILFWAAITLTAIVALRRALDLLPLGQDRRNAALRAYPVVALFIALGFSLLAVTTLFSGYPTALPFALLLVLAAFAIAAVRLARELLAGAALRAEKTFTIGDQLRMGEHEGQVIAFAARTVVLETTAGDTIYVPYTQITETAVVKTRGQDGTSAHSFDVEIPEAASFAHLAPKLRTAALLSHWSTLARTPETTLTDTGQIRVTVHAIDPDHCSDIEADVRLALSKTSARR